MCDHAAEMLSVADDWRRMTNESVWAAAVQESDSPATTTARSLYTDKKHLSVHKI